MSVAPQVEPPLVEHAREQGEYPEAPRPLRRAPRAPRVGLAAALLAAAFNFLWQLGSSSYYVDEVQSLNASLKPLGGFFHALGTIEVSPPAYFLFLHEWLYRFGAGASWLRQLAVGHEWIARLPSAAGGLLLVGAVYWLASLVSDRPSTRAGAAALAAISPFVLEYAQLAQPYVFAALAATVAVAAAIESDQRPRSRARWLTVSLLASVLALCLHYTAALVVAPLCVWLAARVTVPRGWRLAFPAVCTATLLALAPLLLAQHHRFPGRPGTAESGAVSVTSIANVFEAPFTGRVDALRAVGVAVMVVAFALALAVAWRRGAGGPRRGVIGLALGVPLCLLVSSAIGGGAFWGHLMLPRYAAVAVPFMIVSIALAAEALPLYGTVALAICAATVAFAGLIDSHRPSGFYLDARGAVRYIAAHHEPGEPVLAPADDIAGLPLAAYGLNRFDAPAVGRRTSLQGGKRRVWVIAELPQGKPPSAAQMLAFERSALKPLGEQPLRARVFPGIPPLAVVLVGPG